MDNCFVLYKLPNEHKYTSLRQYENVPECLPSVTDLNNKSGFVFAPFTLSSKSPLLLLTPDRIETFDVDENIDFSKASFKPRNREREQDSYNTDFQKFHAALLSGQFSKIVLSRCSEEISKSPIAPEFLFKRACLLCPKLFVALVSMPQCGIWLMATPEVLLEQSNGVYHTMAHAGTRKFSAKSDSAQIDTWSRKNILEQQYVAQYIKNCISDSSLDFRENGPYTFTAANIEHINTDFFFRLKQGEDLGNLLERFFPTPAVCGVPKELSHKFILETESHDRDYYSGFAGLIDNKRGTANLYVTLRCMKIKENHYYIYAGGGLLADSELQSEWFETEAKMNTMRQCLAIR